MFNSIHNVRCVLLRNNYTKNGGSDFALFVNECSSHLKFYVASLIRTFISSILSSFSFSHLHSSVLFYSNLFP